MTPTPAQSALLEAVKPFADLAKLWDHGDAYGDPWDDDSSICVSDPDQSHDSDLTIGHVRRLAEALEAVKAENAALLAAIDHVLLDACLADRGHGDDTTVSNAALERLRAARGPRPHVATSGYIQELPETRPHVTSGYADARSSRRPAQATGDWSEVWDREGEEGDA